MRGGLVGTEGLSHTHSDTPTLRRSLTLRLRELYSPRGARAPSEH